MKRILAILFCSLPALLLQAQKNFSKTYEKIRDLLNQDKYEEAIPLCQQILTADSTEINAVYYKAICDGELGHHAEAATGYARVARFNPKKASYWTGACWHSLFTGAYDSAVVFAEKAVELVPDDYNNYLNLAHAWWLKKDSARTTYYYLLASEYLPHHKAYLESVRKDLTLMDSLNRKWTTASIRQLFEDDYQLLEKNTLSNAILDSIYAIASGDLQMAEESIDSLKGRFIQAQLNEPAKRLKLIRDFSYQRAAYHLVNDNNRDAVDAFKSGIMVDQYLRDSSSLFSRHLYFSKLILKIQLNKQSILPRIGDALYFSEEALRFANEYQLDDSWKVRAWLQLADCYQKGKKYDSALFWLHRSLPMIPAGKSFGLQEELLNDILLIHIDLKKYDSADYYFRLLQNRAPKLEDPYRSFSAVAANYVAYLAKRGMDERAASLALQQARQESRFTASNVQYARLLEIAGLCYHELGKKDSALLLLQESFRAFRAYHHTDREKKTIGKEVFLTDELLEGVMAAKIILAETNQLDKLFELIEQTKEPMLRFLLSSWCNPENTDALAKARSALPADAVAISYTNDIDETGYGIAFTKTQTLLGKQQDKELLQWMSATKQAAAFRKLIQSTRITDTSKRTELYPLIYYMQVSGYRNASRGIIAENKQADSSVYSEQARITMSKLLYRYYIKPYESLLKDKKRLYVSPDLMLNYIPLESLMDENGVYLGEKIQVLYVPSFSILQMLQEKSYEDPKKMLAVGNPDYRNYHPEKLKGKAFDYAFNFQIRSWDELPGTAKELQSVSAALPGCQIIQQSAVSESRIKKMDASGELSRYGTLHFALHGMTNVYAGPDDNALIVSEPDGGKEDGYLRFWEVFNLTIRPRLVFLSACETGFGFPKEDGSSTSLVTAFLAAGAGSCIGTSWKIADEASSLFIRDCYLLTQNGMSWPEAMQKVRQKFIKGEMGESYRNPYYWAPFKYYGF